MPKKVKTTILALTLLTTAACAGGFREAAGLRKDAPDEFRVVSNAPLVVPPEFTLRPPVPGAKGPKDINAQQQAKNILFEKSPSTKSGGETKAESIFLSRAGASGANPDIQNVLSQDEQTELSKQNEKNFFEKSLAKLQGNDKETVVNSSKEKERLANNKKTGKPVNDGDIPTVEPSSGGLLNRVFGF